MFKGGAGQLAAECEEDRGLRNAGFCGIKNYPPKKIKF
jgi:hypothetical protein